jgi:hypothetical protein
MLDKQEELSTLDTRNTSITSKVTTATLDIQSHILNTGHIYGTIEDTVENIKIGRKG